jgi:copper chaperone CopZ
MFNWFKKNLPTNSETVTFKIDGMHCTSCSLNIDGELEETEGVVSAKTSYATGITNVVFQPEKVKPKTLVKKIENLGYTVNTPTDKG